MTSKKKIDIYSKKRKKSSKACYYYENKSENLAGLLEETPTVSPALVTEPDIQTMQLIEMVLR